MIHGAVIEDAVPNDQVKDFLQKKVFYAKEIR